MLGVMLACIPDRDLHTINKALRVYERLHKQRAETLVDLAAANGRELHLGEGAAKGGTATCSSLRLGKAKALCLISGLMPMYRKWSTGTGCIQVAQDSFGELFQSIW